MKFIFVDNPNEGGIKGAQVFKNALANNAKTFGLATGSTPISTYNEITKSNLDFSNKISFNLDEYIGLKPTNPQSYHFYMNKYFFSVKPFAQSYLLNGLATSEEAELARYDRLLEKYPIDLQLLGIGKNGHIGFNEPGTPFDLTSHKVKLTESTIKTNSRFFNNINEVPKYAFSMGIRSIMSSKQILLEAYGEKKADAVAKMINGPVTEQLPASILQTHQNVIVIVDEAAASKI